MAKDNQARHVFLLCLTEAITGVLTKAQCRVKRDWQSVNYWTARSWVLTAATSRQQPSWRHCATDDGRSSERNDEVGDAAGQCSTQVMPQWRGCCCNRRHHQSSVPVWHNAVYIYRIGVVPRLLQTAPWESLNESTVACNSPVYTRRVRLPPPTHQSHCTQHAM